MAAKKGARTKTLTYRLIMQKADGSGTVTIGVYRRGRSTYLRRPNHPDHLVHPAAKWLTNEAALRWNDVVARGAEVWHKIKDPYSVWRG